MASITSLGHLRAAGAVEKAAPGGESREPAADGVEVEQGGREITGAAAAALASSVTLGERRALKGGSVGGSAFRYLGHSRGTPVARGPP